MVAFPKCVPHGRTTATAPSSAIGGSKWNGEAHRDPSADADDAAVSSPAVRFRERKRVSANSERQVHRKLAQGARGRHLSEVRTRTGLDFEQGLREFLDFTQAEGLGPVRFKQCEVIYLNQLPAGEGWENFGDLGESGFLDG